MLSFHIVTLFPELLGSAINCSIIKRAQQSKRLGIHFWNIRDQCPDKHRKADDSPYGGGNGMVMKVDPIIATLNLVKSQHDLDRVILLSASGLLFTQKKAQELSTYKNVMLICGHYEGVDERVTAFVDEELSIGDFVLTGGEPAALVIVDAVCRLIPGVLGNIDSIREESHTGEPLLEHPHYTRPLDFHGMSVPDVLLSGNHAEIHKWRRKESIRRTVSRRPDLWDQHSPNITDIVLLAEIADEASTGAATVPPVSTEAIPNTAIGADHDEQAMPDSNLTIEVEKS